MAVNARCRRRLLPGAYAQLLCPKFRAFCGQHLILWRTHVPADPIFLDGIDDDLISKLVAADEELHGFVCSTVFLLKPIIIDLNSDTVLVAFMMRLPQST